jgi:uncharacterized membrane protein
MKQRTVIRIAMLCAMVGIGFALYIQLIHMGVNAPGCRVNSYVDCRLVLDSPYTAIILGIPNQIVALAGFSLVFSLGFIRSRFPHLRHSDKIIYMMTGLNLFGACLGTYLQGISVFIIHGLCPFCVSAYTCDLISVTFESTYFITRFLKRRRRAQREFEAEKSSNSS